MRQHLVRTSQRGLKEVCLKVTHKDLQVMRQFCPSRIKLIFSQLPNIPKVK